MNAIDRFAEAEQMMRGGMTETQVAIRLGVRQGTISKLMALRRLTSDVLAAFAGSAVSLAALTEIANYSADDQRAALADIADLARRGRARRRDVAKAMALRTLKLDHAPFPTVGCARCYDRTGAQPDFFGHAVGLGRCLRRSCFARCLNAVEARKVKRRKHERKEG